MDITFAPFEQELDLHKIFFPNDRHPIESSKASVIQNSIRDTNMVFQTALQVFPLTELSQEKQQLMDEILRLIQREIPEDCPSVQEIQALYIPEMMPVPGIGK